MDQQRRARAAAGAQQRASARIDSLGERALRSRQLQVSLRGDGDAPEILERADVFGMDSGMAESLSIERYAFVRVTNDTPTSRPSPGRTLPRRPLSTSVV